ncbi:MAG: hypothetical protein AAF740_07920 [Bacteroidota bacterium]
MGVNIFVSQGISRQVFWIIILNAVTLYAAIAVKYGIAHAFLVFMISWVILPLILSTSRGYFEGGLLSLEIGVIYPSEGVEEQG